MRHVQEMMPDDSHPVRAVDEDNVRFPGFDLLTALFIGPAQHLPTAGRAGLVTHRVLSVDQMWWVRRQKAGQNFARFRHDLPSSQDVEGFSSSERRVVKV